MSCLKIRVQVEIYVAIVLRAREWLHKIVVLVVSYCLKKIKTVGCDH